MELQLDNIGKRYDRQWIFKGISKTISNSGNLGIKGPNGSGKSTLLKVISGFLTPSKGKVNWQGSHQDYSRRLNYIAPYIDLFEELTLEEHLKFYSGFRPFQDNLSVSEVIKIMKLEAERKKYIKDFSSGMKQRVKLGLHICAAGDILLLDEPTTNLDQEGVSWYKKLLIERIDGRLTIIASNEVRDFIDCSEYLLMEHYSSS